MGFVMDDEAQIKHVNAIIIIQIAAVARPLSLNAVQHDSNVITIHDAVTIQIGKCARSRSGGRC